MCTYRGVDIESHAIDGMDALGGVRRRIHVRGGYMCDIESHAIDEMDALDMYPPPLTL